MVTTLSHIPVSVFQIIQQFVNQLEYWFLMNVAKDTFQNIKRETIYFVIKDKYTEELFKNPYLQYLLLQKIRNPTKQLTIQISHVAQIQSNFQVPQCQKLIIKDSKINSIRIFQDVDDLTLTAKKSCLTDCDGLHRVKSLTISNFNRLTNLFKYSQLTKCAISSCSELVDVSPLAGVREVSLSKCERVVNVNVLKHVHKLELCECIRVTNVDELGNVFDLTILSCSRLSDITMLTNNHSIRIENCPVRDFGSLSRATVVRLRSNSLYPNPSYFEEATDLAISMVPVPYNSRISPQFPRKVRSLDFEAAIYAAQFIDLAEFERLQYLHTLRLSSLGYDFDCSPLRVVRNLQLHRCSLRSTRGLGHDPAEYRSNYRVNLSECYLLSDLSGLRGIPLVRLDRSSLYTPLSNEHLVESREVQLLESKKIAIVFSFSPSTESVVVEVSQVTSLEVLRDVPRIILLNAHNVVDLRSLTGNQVITLTCDKVNLVRPDHWLLPDSFSLAYSSKGKFVFVRKLP
jgi:hypothetical protein